MRPLTTLGVARQAEGAILAAAGHQDSRVVQWGTVGGMRKPVGLGGTGTNPETLAEISAMIGGVEGAEPEVRYAAAAAFAALRV